MDDSAVRTLVDMSACAQCGEDNPQRGRYCWACGAALPVERSTAGEARKTVTVLFSDLRSSTRLSEALDAESHRSVIGRYFEEMRSVIERHGGIVEKFIGDAVMGIFGLPVLHEDDALRAVRAALEMRESLARLNEDLRGSWGLELQARTGVNTGEVVAGNASSGQMLVTGDAVVVAKRLEEAAGPDEIQLGETTYRLVRDAVTAELVGEIALKGKSDPVPTWRLLSVTASIEAPALRLDSTLVGRELDLAALEGMFDRAVAERSCHLLTVLGPAGIGKSRLTHEFVERLGGRATVLRGRCLSYGEGITFWPIVELVREAAGLTDGDGAEPARLKIASLLPAGGDSLLVCERVAAAVGRGAAEVRTEEVLWAVRKLLEALAADRPLVVVFDDVHWAEGTFLDLVEYLAGWSREKPILIVALARPDLLDLRPAWAVPRANSAAVLLESLIESESDLLIRNLLGETGLDEATRSRIAGAAEGNPLFVGELLRMLVDDGVLRREPGGWSVGDLSRIEVPPSIHALLAARLDRLEPDERTVIQRAAVIGQAFWWGGVAELSPEWGDARVVGRLQALVRKELIRPERSGFLGEDAFRFSHILIRDAAYAALPKEVRATLHERLAAWLERTAAGRTDEYDEIVCYHLEQAYRYRRELGRAAEAGELARHAGECLTSAGRRASSRGDLAAASTFLGRAAAVLPPGDEARPGLLVELGVALRECGSLARAGEVLEEAVSLAAAVRNARLEARARIEQSLLRAYTDSHEGIEESRQLAAEAITCFEEAGDDLGLARAWGLLAQVSWFHSRLAEMEQVAERALYHAERAGDRRQVSAILSDLARAALVGPKPVEAAIRRCRQLMERAGDDRLLTATIEMLLAPLEAARGRFDEARELSSRSRAVHHEFGVEVGVAGATVYAGVVELLAGEPAAAESLLTEAYSALEGMGERGRLSVAAAFISRAVCAQGRYDEAERWTAVCEEAATTEDVVSQVVWRGVRARVLVRRAEVEAGLALAREAVRLAAETDFLQLHGDALIDLADVLRGSGRAEESAAAAERALGLYRAKGNVVAVAAAERLRERMTGVGSRS